MKIIGLGKIRKTTIEKIIYAFLFLITFLILLPYLREQVFMGCDTSAHYYLAEKMLEYLQSLRINGYDVNWFGGVPLFIFYNPLPYIVVCLVHLLSFKALAISTSFNLVLFIIPFLFLVSVRYAADAFFSNRRISLFAFIFAFIFFFIPDNNSANVGIGVYSQYFTGLFTNSFAWPIFIFLMGFIKKLKETNQRKYLFLSILFFSFLILSHILTTIFAVFLFFIYFIMNFKDRVFVKNSIVVSIASLILTSFFWIPFLENIRYASPTDYIFPYINSTIFLLIFFSSLFSFLGIIGLLKEKKYFFPVSLLFSSLFLVSGAMSLIVPINIHYYRFWGGIILINIFICAYGLNYLIERLHFRGKSYVLMGITWILIFYMFFSASVFNGTFSLFEKDDYEKESDEVTKSFDVGRVFIDQLLTHDFIGNRHYYNYYLPMNNMPVFNGLLIESSLFYEENEQSLFSYIDFYSEFLEYQGFE
jgi:hypothetical protein